MNRSCGQKMRSATSAIQGCVKTMYPNMLSSMPPLSSGSEKLEPTKPPTDSTSETIIEILTPSSPGAAALAEAAVADGFICRRRRLFAASLTDPR